MSDDIETKRLRRRRLSRQVRKAVKDFHRNHERRHLRDSLQYISRAHAVVIGSMSSRERIEIMVFVEGKPASWDDVKCLCSLSNRYFDNDGIAHRGRYTGFITTYWQKEDSAMTNDNTDKPLEPYVIVERSVFDALFASLSRYERIGRFENGHAVVDAARALRDKIKAPSGDSPIEGADVVCDDEPQNFVCEQPVEDERLNDTRYIPVPAEAVKALSKRRYEWLTTQNSAEALREAREAYMHAAGDLLNAVEGKT